MSSESLYDVIVVGAGIEGSATAYQLSKKNVRVLLLEQFPLPHSRGSSHGQSRITRKAYAEDFYTDMMQYCTQQWELLQREANTFLFKKSGFVAIGKSNGDYLKQNETSLHSNKAEYQVLDTAMFREKYPDIYFDDGWGAVYDPEGGVLMADKCLRAFQSQFVRNGGVLHDSESVTRIEPGDICHVITNKATYRTKSLVLCCGPWSGSMCRQLNLNLPLQAVRINVCYWPEKIAGTYNADKCPTFFEMEESSFEIYGLPSLEYPGHVKICLHDGPSISPDNRDSVDSGWTIDFLRKYVKEHFPGLVPEPSFIETCIYTNTPDKHFVLDRHPRWKNIIIGAGFSGHGFKLSPAVGKILADLSVGVNPDYDISHFRISRFGPPAASKL